MVQAISIQAEVRDAQDDGYERWREAQDSQLAFAASHGQFFTTDVENLFDIWLNALPEHARQHYNCRSCRRFVEQFGGLVAITQFGATVPALWPEPEFVPQFFADASRACTKAVRKAKITGVHCTTETVWGTPQNTAQSGPYEGRTWHHMHAVPPAHLVRARHPLKTASQEAAEKAEEYKMLRRGLAEFNADTARQALHLLTSGTLARAEKCIGVAKWFSELHGNIDGVKNSRFVDGLVWSAVATAPPDFAHIRSSMIGTLLEDIQSNTPLDEIKAKFDAKMNPAIYQRPQAAPSAGNLAQAEKVVAALAASGSLRRRFARLSDVKALWSPTPPKNGEESESVFGHIAAKGEQAKPSLIPSTKMTWVKFRDEVLDGASKIELEVPGGATSFCALVTACDPDAPPIIQWDTLENRNPVSWYGYVHGSVAHQWNLKSGNLTEVKALCLQPSMWTGEHAHQGKGVVLILDGASDVRGPTGIALFPEILKSEFHGIRASIEAYSASKRFEGADVADACGLALQSGGTWNVRLRVTGKDGQVRDVILDRWD